MGLMVAGLFYFSKWYAKRNKISGDNNKIRVLTQHFLGPRKSIAIIRVAGETMLIGVTDQNISMLKSLSLIDDEFPDTTPKNFQTALDGADEKIAANANAYSENTDDFIVNNIKDKISEKIKSMRNI